MSKVKKEDSAIGQITEKILQRTMIKLKIKTTHPWSQNSTSAEMNKGPQNTLMFLAGQASTPCTLSNLSATLLQTAGRDQFQKETII